MDSSRIPWIPRDSRDSRDYLNIFTGKERQVKCTASETLVVADNDRINVIIPQNSLNIILIIVLTVVM